MATALRDQSSKLLGYRVGADDFLNHPVDRIELGVRVAGLLALRERHQSLTRRNEARRAAALPRRMSSTVVHDLKNRSPSSSPTSPTRSKSCARPATSSIPTCRNRSSNRKRPVGACCAC
jgi:DNA-binding response OmpR family regulator